MSDLIREKFPGLKEADFGRIRLYISGSRGSVLKKISRDIPDAKTLLEKCKGGTSKRVYILLKSGAEDRGSRTRTVPPSSGSDGGNTIATAGTSTIPTDGGSDGGIPTATAGTSTIPTDGGSGGGIPTATAGTSHISGYESIRSDRYSNVSTRRFLASLAGSSNMETQNDNADSSNSQRVDASQMQDSIQLVIDDDADLQHSPFDDSVIELDPNQEYRLSALLQPRRQTSRSLPRSLPTSGSLSTAGFFGTPFYSEGNQVGITTGDLSPHGLGVESNLPSRTNEVVRCEQRLLASCKGEDTFNPAIFSKTLS